MKFDHQSEKATYKSGTGTTALVFEITLQQYDAANGIAIEANKLTLPTGATPNLNATIRDTINHHDATLTHSAVAADSNHKVDASGPEIYSDWTDDKYGITITSTPTSNNTYLKNEKIQVQVEFKPKRCW